MKAIWKGTLVCGLLEIPVKLYSAVEERTIGARLLCAKCHTPVMYQRYCPHCKKSLEWEKVVRGIKLEDGSYFILTEEKLKKMRPESSNQISLVECVPTDTINSIYYDHHYYLAPQKVTQKGYFLLRQSLEDMDMSGICTMIIRDKEYVCALQSHQNGFLLTTLNYAYEIRPMSRIEQLSVTVKVEATKQECELTEKLIKKLSKKKFDISGFKDNFAEQLKEVLKRAGAGKKAIKERAKKAVIKKIPKDFVDVLKASIESVGKSKKTRK